MSREIKFRCWSKDYNKMIYEFNPTNHGGEINFSIDNHYDDGLSGGSDYALIPMQFTGLFDKNGKEIYEGDICTHKGLRLPFTDIVTIGEIKYDVVNAGFGLYNKNGVGYLLSKIEINEIIGNIYENPELI